jgi:hypothetical protein
MLLNHISQISSKTLTKTEEGLCHVMPVTGLERSNTGKDDGGGGGGDDSIYFQLHKYVDTPFWHDALDMHVCTYFLYISDFCESCRFNRFFLLQ